MSQQTKTRHKNKIQFWQSSVMLAANRVRMWPPTLIQSELLPVHNTHFDQWYSAARIQKTFNDLQELFVLMRKNSVWKLNDNWTDMSIKSKFLQAIHLFQMQLVKTSVGEWIFGKCLWIGKVTKVKLNSLKDHAVHQLEKCASKLVERFSKSTCLQDDKNMLAMSNSVLDGHTLVKEKSSMKKKDSDRNIYEMLGFLQSYLDASASNPAQNSSECDPQSETLADNLLSIRLILGDNRKVFANRIGVNEYDLVLVENKLASSEQIYRVARCLINKVLENGNTNTLSIQGYQS